MRFKSTDEDRVKDRAVEDARKKAKRRASTSGSLVVVPVQPVEGPSLWRRMFDAVTGKAKSKTCEKCKATNTAKQFEKRRGCPKCGAKSSTS